MEAGGGISGQKRVKGGQIRSRMGMRSVELIDQNGPMRLIVQIANEMSSWQSMESIMY